MKKTCCLLCLFTGLLATRTLTCHAEEPPAQQVVQGHAPEVAYPVEEPVFHTLEEYRWARLKGWLFRRYAGSVEMLTKTEYPKTYHGRYTYRYWRPDWVRPTFRQPYPYEIQEAVPAVPLREEPKAVPYELER